MIRNSTNQISIRPKVSRSTKLGLAMIFAMMTVVVVYFSYQMGMKSGNEKLGQDAAVIEQLNSNVDNLQNQLDAANEKNVFADRQQQIQAEAYKQMSNAYASSEQKNRYLGSRLDFYRSIISPEGGQSGPAIQGLEYRQEEDAKIAFDLTLVQAIKHGVQVTGNVSAELYQGDRLIETWPDSGSRSVNYQYFQQISGTFESLAASEIVLENAKISVNLSLHDGTLIERSFTIDPEQL